jgi:hypothetical protein
MNRLKRGLLAATGAAAAGTLAGIAFAGPAGAATGPAQYTTNSAGYVVTGANFENLTTTVGARSVAQYNATANKTGFGHGITLQSKQYTAALGISVYHGDNGPNPWDAAFALYNASSTTVPVASCLAGNNGGSGGVSCNASVSGEPGAFATGPVKLTLTYNPATNLLSFDATQTTTAGVNDFNGSINLGVTFGTPTTYFKTAEVGTTVDAPSSQPAQPRLLGKFSATSLISYSGVTGGVSHWTAHQQIATSDGTSAGTPLLSPTALSSHGHVFEVIDDQS